MIYILEDDMNIRELVIYALSTEKLEAVGFERPSMFWRALDNDTPDLLILDIMLPEEDGLSILRKIRQISKYRELPVIMLTARTTEYDKVTGLDAGADDYLTKPFGVLEMVSRVKALLRRSKRGTYSPDEFKTGMITLNTKKHTVEVSGKEISLTLKEYELLEYLMKNEGVVITRDDLLSRIWGYEFKGESRTVDVHIRTLRQKLGKAENYIQTVRGVGYKIKEEAYEN